MYRNLFRASSARGPSPALRRRTSQRTHQCQLTLEPLETRLAPVIGARPNAFPAPVQPGGAYDGVVKLFNPQGALCTGSLLFTGRHILTAAHCVGPAGNYTVNFDLPGSTTSLIVPSTSVTSHPRWTGDVGAGNDIAILQLPEEAPAAAQRYSIYEQDNELTKTFTFVGYGKTGWGAVGDTCGRVAGQAPDPRCSSGTKRSGQNTFDAVNDILVAPAFPPHARMKPAFPSGTALVSDFDSGLAANDALGHFARLNHLGLANEEGMGGRGDSGGPGFIDGAIASITSYGVGFQNNPDVRPGVNSSFGELFVTTRVSAFASWIRQVVANTWFAVTVPGNVQPGVAFNITVTALNANGNVVPGYTGTVQFTTSDPAGNVVLPANYRFLPADGGTKTFPVTLRTAGLQTVRATDVANAGITGSGSTQVGALDGVVIGLSFTSQVVWAVAGTAFQVVVVAHDSTGAAVPGYRGTVRFASTDPNATLPANYTFVAADNGVHTFTITLRTVSRPPSRGQVVLVQDTANANLWAGDSIAVDATATSRLAVVTEAATVRAGSAFNVVVAALDAHGNITPDYRGTVNFTSNDPAPNVVLPGNHQFTAADGGIREFPNQVTLRTAGARRVTATDTAVAAITGFVNLTVGVPGVSRFLVEALTNPVTAGANFNVRVTALDVHGATVTGYRGTVTFLSLDFRATLPPDYTFVAADNGVHTFNNVRFLQAGRQSILVEDDPTDTINGIVFVEVVPAATTRLGVTLSENPAVAGTPLTVTVTAQDAHGNTTPNYRGTVTFTSNDGNASLPPNTAFRVTDRGVRTFPATLNTVGNRTITATDTADRTITGNGAAAVVAPAAAARFALSSAANPVNAGAQFNVTVRVLDALGYVTPGYTGTVTFTGGGAGATLPANHTFTAADGGVRAFPVTLTAAGNQTVTATDTIRPGLTGGVTVRVNPLAPVRIGMAPAANPVRLGAPGAVTLAMLDVHGNVATSYTGSVDFTSSDPSAILPSRYTFSAADQGVLVFQATLFTLGNQSISARDADNPALYGDTTVTVIENSGYATATGLVASSPSSQLGEPVTWIAQVTASEGGIPQGYVTFWLNGQPWAVRPLAGGVATLVATALPAGMHEFIAVYNGSATHEGSTSVPAGHVVNRGLANTTVRTSLTGAFYTQLVTFTATVQAVPPGAVSPTGQVAFFANGFFLGSSELTNGVASLATSSLFTGTHEITAYYYGDANYDGSVSPVLNQVIRANQTITSTPSSSRNPSYYTESVTFSVLVTPAGTPLPGPVGGSVAFFANGMFLGSSEVADGMAALTVSGLYVGTHEITAYYYGDGTFEGSNSPVLTQTVNANNTTTTRPTSSLNPSMVNEPVTFTVNVAPSGTPLGGPPTGTVAFFANGMYLGATELVNGVATLESVRLFAGTHEITAYYYGDGTFEGSNSLILLQVVNEPGAPGTPPPGGGRQFEQIPLEALLRVESPRKALLALPEVSPQPVPQASSPAVSHSHDTEPVMPMRTPPTPQRVADRLFADLEILEELRN